MSFGFDEREPTSTAAIASFSPVLSLTVLDACSLRQGVLRLDSRMLVVVRRPTSNPTHPNVVSVPTQRLPRWLFSELVADAEEAACVKPGSVYAGKELDSHLANGHHPVVYATEALLARKLGAAGLLERSEMRFRAALRSRVAGYAMYDGSSPYGRSEPIDMLNVVVAVNDARDAMPAETSSYSHVLWTSVSSFLEALNRRDPTIIDPHLDPVELCIHGLCLAATESSIRTLLDARTHQPVTAGHRVG